MINHCLLVSTIKRRPSPSASSLSSNSSTDRRTADSIQLTKFGTQSPDAINKLFRLSDSNHHVKSRLVPKSHPHTTVSILRHASPIIPSTGFTSLRESSAQKITRMRDTNKLTSESSSLNLKTPPSTFYIRTHYGKSSMNSMQYHGYDFQVLLNPIEN